MLEVQRTRVEGTGMTGTGQAWVACVALVLALAQLVVGCRPPAAAAVEAEALLSRREYATAQARVQQGLTHDPDSRPLWRLRVRIYMAQGQRAEAVEAYRERAINHGEDRDLLRRLSVEVIGWGLGNRDPEVRLAAIQAARETDAAELEEQVAARLGDPDPVVRTWAAVALSARPDGADLLDQQLRAADPRAREIAVRELGRIAGPAALRTLQRGAADPDPRVRGAAASGLAWVRGHEALELLRRLLRDPDASVRAAAVRAAQSLKLDDLAPDLRRLITDPSLPARLAAVSALASLGESQARPALETAAASKDLFVALRAGLALARMGTIQPALNAVAQALVDRQWTLRAAACTAASLLRDRVGLQLVEKALHDPEPRVRLAAARALLAGRPELREASVRVGRSVQAGSCARPGQAAPAPELCVEASDFLVRAGRGEGMDLLKQLARRGPTASSRLAALRTALMLVPNRWLAVDGMADPDGRIALFSASWLYRRLR